MVFSSLSILLASTKNLEYVSKGIRCERILYSLSNKHYGRLRLQVSEHGSLFGVCRAEVANPRSAEGLWVVGTQSSSPAQTPSPQRGSLSRQDRR